MEDRVFTFGKYKNDKIKDIILKDPRYVEWANANVDGFTLDNNEASYLESINKCYKYVKDNYYQIAHPQKETLPLYKLVELHLKGELQTRNHKKRVYSDKIDGLQLIHKIWCDDIKRMEEDVALGLIDEEVMDIVDGMYRIPY